MSDKLVAKVESLTPSTETGLAKCEIGGKEVDIRFPLKNGDGEPFVHDLYMGTHLVFERKELENWLQKDYKASTYRKANQEEIIMAEQIIETSEQDDKKDKHNVAEISQNSSDCFTYPFNFVRPAKPLYKKRKADALHDRFHIDRYSGSITCIMTAKSPLFIPDPEGWDSEYLQGHTSEKEKIHWKKSFFRLPDNGPYAIPGSTTKGMIRSVAEAASNSCFSVFVDRRFAYRLTRNISHGRLPGKILASEKKVIEMRVAKIGMDALTQLCLKELAVVSSNNKIEFKIVDLFRKGMPEVVWAKHGDIEWPTNTETIEGEGKVVENGGRYFVQKEGDTSKTYRLPKSFSKCKGKKVKFKAAELPRWSRGASWYVSEIDGKSTFKGPFKGWVKYADRGDKTTKKTHQVFYDLNDPPKYFFEDSIIEDYRVAQDGKSHKNPKELREGQLVFFEQDGENVTSIGPVHMYKNAYRYSTGHFLSALGEKIAGEENAFIPCGDDDKACPACQLFGFIPNKENTSQQAMAGRVFFSTARCINETVSPTWIPLRILSSPKPKYYPFYLTDKTGQNNYQIPNSSHPVGNWTWQDNRTRLRGRKFYWHHIGANNITDWKQYLSGHPLENGECKTLEKSDQNLTVESLPVGTKFSFEVKFENLSKEELGLLLFSIDFDDEKKGAMCHHIGMGKPLGMGSVKLNIKDVKLYNRQDRYLSLSGTGLNPKEEIENTLKKAKNEFRTAMESANKTKQGGKVDFDKIPNIADLFRIADSVHPATGDVRYRPLKLKPDENYLWFGGKKPRHRTKRVYSSPRKPLPTVVEISDGSKRMTQGEWLEP